MRLPRRLLSAALACFSVASLSFAQAPAKEPNPFDSGDSKKAVATTLTKENKDEVLRALSDVVTKQAFVPGVDLSKWDEYIQKKQADIDKAEKEGAFAQAINDALRDFGVSHIRFLTTRSSQARRQTSTVGIGIQTRKLDAGLQILFVYPKSPAETAGLRNGETILKVDGKEVGSSDSLQGEDGSESTLILKGSDGTEREVKIKRAPYSTVRPDSLRWVGEDAAVLKLHSFSRGYQAANVEKMVEEASAKAKYLVIDLRSNGGGAVSNLNHFLSLLLPDKSDIGAFIYRRTSDKYAQEHGGVTEVDPVVIAKGTTDRFRTNLGSRKPFPGKIAVLINRGSASASEIFAAALRENLKSPLLGSNSAGAVLASVYRRLPMGFEIQYPVSDYVTRDGIRLEKHPLVPDVEVSEPATEDNDPTVIKAIETLRGSL